ncbi:MAG: Flp family type IVb pilin [Xanthobacteraceae bacterium]|nr:MAG: Flp family type IVb pilin [Xanthobacteraceae bacterium]
MQLLIRFCRDRRAATSIEYAMVAAGIAVAIAGAVAVLSGKVVGNFTSISNAF